MRDVAPIDADPFGHPGTRLGFGGERLHSQVEKREGEFSDLRVLAWRSESRIVALSEELSRSRADFESTSARFNELAAGVPADIAGLSSQLSRILNAADTEADEIRAAAHRYADAVRIGSEERAAEIIAEAQHELESATALRADLEAHSAQTLADIAGLREQAALNAADIVRDAKAAAEEMLAQVHRDVDAQRALAQAKLDELIQVRANIADQLKNFYDKFNKLDDSVGPVRRVESVCLDPVALTPEALRRIG
jgi:hypothetical protein